VTTGTILDYEGLMPGIGVKDNTRPSEHAEGYLWQGPWQAVADGFAEHCRRQALALHEAGAVVQLRGLSSRAVEDPVAHAKNEAKLAKLLDASVSRYVTEIYMMVPTERLMERLLMPKIRADGQLALEPVEQAVVDAHRVLYTVWERDKLSRGALDLMKRVGQCWVGCRANAEMLVRSGLEPARVKVVPCPHFPDDPHLALQCRSRMPGPPRFYHIGKWEPRKAQDKILEAFLLAFKPGQAMLSMRCGALGQTVPGYPQSMHQALFNLLQRDDVKANGWTTTTVQKRIRLYPNRMSEGELLCLHREGDVYVTLSRGEGFDMPAMDAKLAGNLMLYTPSGGPQDFCGGKDAQVPKTGMIPAHPMYEWADTQYLDFSIEHAVSGMRKMAERALEHDRVADAWLLNFTAAAVGKRMLAHLAELKVQAEPVRQQCQAWMEQRQSEFAAERARRIAEWQADVARAQAEPPTAEDSAEQEMLRLEAEQRKQDAKDGGRT
jgi:glycosyltransferase involved in cell wall biosynthesis